MFIVIIILCAVVAYVLRRSERKLKALRREAFIRSFTLPPRLFNPLQAHHPHLNLKDCQLVAQGLRQFFMAYLKSGYGYVSMPSQAVDDLWHEFILHTRDYQEFCDEAFGRFLHHTPAVVISKNAPRQSNVGLQRCWWFACREENINPNAPSRLPLLFALDSKLNIALGFHYLADCESVRKVAADGTESTVIHCGSALIGGSSDGSFSADTSGYGSDDSGHHGHGGTHSCSGGDSHGGGGGDSSSGCGGGGCGGGGCGGGGSH